MQNSDKNSKYDNNIFNFSLLLILSKNYKYIPFKMKIWN